MADKPQRLCEEILRQPVVLRKAKHTMILLWSTVSWSFNEYEDLTQENGTAACGTTSGFGSVPADDDDEVDGYSNFHS